MEMYSTVGKRLMEGSDEADYDSEDPNQAVADAVPRIANCLNSLCMCEKKKRKGAERR